jgi:hypothetical protein
MRIDPRRDDVTRRHQIVADALRALGFDARTRPSNPGQVRVLLPEGEWAFEDGEAPWAGYTEDGFFTPNGADFYDTVFSVDLPRHDGEEPEGAHPDERLRAILTILHDNPVADHSTKEAKPMLSKAGENILMDDRVSVVRALSAYLRNNPTGVQRGLVTRPEAEYHRCSYEVGGVRCTNDGWVRIDRDSYKRDHLYCRDHTIRGLTEAEEAIDLDNFEVTVTYLVACQGCGRPEVLLPYYTQDMIGWGYPCIACIKGQEGFRD